MNKPNWADWMELSAGAVTWALRKRLQFQIAFLFSLLLFFSYIQNEALCGSKWCIFQLLVWNCHFDGSRCCDNSHQINLSKTLNERRVFKESATARSAAGVWVKSSSFRGRSGEDTEECWGEVWNGTLLRLHVRKRLRARWLGDPNVKLTTVTFLFV